MKNRPTRASQRARQTPLDHLRPGSQPTEPDADRPTGDQTANRADRTTEPAHPAEPTTPGAADTDAARGRATRSPAEVATRRHLEGSEQGPM